MRERRSVDTAVEGIVAGVIGFVPGEDKNFVADPRFEAFERCVRFRSFGQFFDHEVVVVAALDPTDD